MIIMFVRAYQRGAIMTADLCVSKFSSTSTRNAKAPSLQYMTRSKGRRIAYHSTPGGSPGVIFCSGFMSNMGGMKALALEEYCQTKGHAFTRFDYLACGQSDGDPRDVTFSDWRDDMMAVLNELTTGPQIMVGSSMGGWLVLLAALAHPDRIHSLICVASAPDFKQRRVELLGPKILLEQLDNLIYGNKEVLYS